MDKLVSIQDLGKSTVPVLLLHCLKKGVELLKRVLLSCTGGAWKEVAPTCKE